jgi:hypothetical protein
MRFLGQAVSCKLLLTHLTADSWAHHQPLHALCCRPQWQ